MSRGVLCPEVTVVHRGLLRQDGEDCSRMVWCGTTRPRGALRENGVPRRHCCGVADRLRQTGRAITVLPTSRVGARVRFAGCKQVQASTSKLPFAIETACMRRVCVLETDAHFRCGEVMMIGWHACRCACASNVRRCASVCCGGARSIRDLRGKNWVIGVILGHVHLREVLLLHRLHNAKIGDPPGPATKNHLLNDRAPRLRVSRERK